MDTFLKSFISYLFEFGLVSMKTINCFVISYEKNKVIIDNIENLEPEDKLKLVLLDYFQMIFQISSSVSKESNEEVQLNNKNKTIKNINNYALLEILCLDLIDKFKENLKLKKIIKCRTLLKFYKFSIQSKKYKYFMKFKEKTILYSRVTKLNLQALSRNKKENLHKNKQSCVQFLCKNEEDISKQENYLFNVKSFSNNRNYNLNFNTISRPDETLFYRLYEESNYLKEKLDSAVPKKIENKKKVQYPKQYLNKLLNNSNKIEIQEKQSLNTINDDNLVSSKSKPKLSRANSYCNINRTITGNKQIRAIDSVKINNLHDDYKKKNIRVKEILTTIEKENGITFKPNLIKGGKYKVSTTFEQRNLQPSSKLSKSSNKSNSQSLNKTSQNNSMTKREIDTIRSSVVNKFYSEKNSQDEKSKIIIHPSDQILFGSPIDSQDISFNTIGINKIDLNKKEDTHVKNNYKCKDYEKDIDSRIIDNDMLNNNEKKNEFIYFTDKLNVNYQEIKQKDLDTFDLAPDISTKLPDLNIYSGEEIIEKYASEKIDKNSFEERFKINIKNLNQNKTYKSSALQSIINKSE